jgi:hypothetical protein
MNRMKREWLRVRFSRNLAAALTIAALAACASSKSPAEGLTFHAPDGWVSAPNTLARVQTWTRAGAEVNTLTLMATPPGLKLDALIREQGRILAAGSIPPGAAGPDIEQRQTVLCGNQPSYFRKTNIASHDTHFIAESVVTSTPGSGYMATYMYQAGHAPDPQAEAAIFDLCPAK